MILLSNKIQIICLLNIDHSQYRLKRRLFIFLRIIHLSTFADLRIQLILCLGQRLFDFAQTLRAETV